jgi:hypothetical protein
MIACGEREPYAEEQQDDTRPRNASQRKCDGVGDLCAGTTLQAFGTAS